MSFGPSQQTKNATAQNAEIATQAKGNSTNEINQGGGLLNSGGDSIHSGTNFFNTLLNGNQANTTSLLQPNIDQIRGTNAATINSMAALSPRGGGRSGALFGAAYSPTSTINSLFGGLRGTAATTLPQIGLGQQQIGTSLVGAGNNALNTGSQTNTGLMDYGLRQQDLTSKLQSNFGGGLFHLGTTPLNPAGSTLFGKLFGMSG